MRNEVYMRSNNRFTFRQCKHRNLPTMLMNILKFHENNMKICHPR